MAVTDLALVIEELARSDAAAALALSDEAGWNQTLEDWNVFFAHGIVFGMRDGDGCVIATAALLPSPPITWISMVLVTAKWRRRGFANALLMRCIETARARGLEAWLDATPAGAAIYRPIGFHETGLRLLRLRRRRDAGASQSTTVSDKRLLKLLDADRRAMGFDRGEIIKNFARRERSAVYEMENAVALVRAGRKARQIGPVYAADEGAAIELLSQILEREDGSLVVDLSAAHSKAHDFLLSGGFAFERPFARMRFGAALPKASGGSHELVAVAGPEFG
jgi:GNAT superfamily N-acetyltransferase